MGELTIFLGERKLVKLEKAADQLGISHWTLRQHCTKKKVEHFKFSHRLFIPQDEIDRILVEARVERIA